MKYEVAIGILDGKYADSMIIALVRQGYSVYYNEDLKCVCFTATDGEITAIEDDKRIPCTSGSGH
jgi:hypothetical protein